MKVLLIFPPFATSQMPHLALPSLSAYLRSVGIETAVVDSNIEFYHYFLTRKRVDEGRKFALPRLHELNEKPSLSQLEKMEYMLLFPLFMMPEEMFNLDIVFGHDGDALNLGKKLSATRANMQAACAPYYPERIETKLLIDTVKYYPSGCKFLVDDLVDSVDQPTLMAGFFEKFLPSIIKKEKPDIVGISAAFDDQINGALLCAKVLRKLLPKNHITLGGSFVTTSMSHISNKRIFDLVDSLVIGEGEIPLEKLVRECGSDRPDFSKVPGLIYLDGEEIKKNTVIAPIPIESLPMPDYTAFPLDRYTMPKQFMGLPFRSSRGCYWNKCTFCNTDSLKITHYEQSSAEYIYNTVTTASELTGVTYFNFADSATTVSVLEKFSSKIIEKKKNIRWTTSLRLDNNVTLDRCQLFRSAGCSNLFLGLETYNDRILKLVEKGTTVESINFVLSNISWADIYIFAYMMVGFPTETEEEARATYKEVSRMAKEGIISKISYNPLLLYPGSKYYHHPERYGITKTSVLGKRDLDGIIHEYETPGMSRTTAWKLAVEFTLGSHLNFDRDIQVAGKPFRLKHDPNVIYYDILSDPFYRVL